MAHQERERHRLGRCLDLRRDALQAEASDLRAIRLLTGGAVAQAVVGMTIVLGAVLLWSGCAPNRSPSRLAGELSKLAFASACRHAAIRGCFSWGYAVES